MTKYYRDYKWKDGIPYGVDTTDEIALTDTFKIVMDPYRKRISIEKYNKGQFDSIIYDTVLLDFRQLKKPEQTAWQKLPVRETDDQSICLIRDQDDRLLFIETHRFAGRLCRECLVNSPHGIPLSVHRMFYISQKDPFDGVVLYDRNDRPVMYKSYQFDPEVQQFTTLIEENWNLENNDHLKMFKV